ncbi:MAG TPA: ROK family protein [Christiangramia sp.]|nr:ROK family protein [Christiangramia sp.]
MNHKIIGVDIGATKIQVGIVENGKLTREIKFPTLSGSSKKDIMRNLIEGIESIGTFDCIGIGIGVPGLINEEEGIVYDLLNISSWKEVHLKKHLEDHFKIPVKITNDANIFALGLRTFGEGRKFKNFVGIAMGTGFGTGIIANGELYSGNLSGAGELGSIPYLDKTIEDYCSGKFFKVEHGLKGSEVCNLAEKGDQKALMIMEEYGKHLGEAIKLMLYILAPEAIFLGGSVSKSFKYFEPALRKSIGSFPFKRILDQLVVKTSDIENIPILGAAALIVSENKSFIEKH